MLFRLLALLEQCLPTVSRIRPPASTKRGSNGANQSCLGTVIAPLWGRAWGSRAVALASMLVLRDFAQQVPFFGAELFLLIALKTASILEAQSGVEPLWTDLQSAA